MDDYLNVLGLSVIICYDKTGDWERDKVLLCEHSNQTIEEDEVLHVIQYLYDEGFIVDRKISYEIIVAKGGDNEKEEGNQEA